MSKKITVKYFDDTYIYNMGAEYRGDSIKNRTLKRRRLIHNPNLNLVAAKMQKIEKYTEYSESLGQVTPSKSLEPTEGVPKKHCQNGRADICLAGAVDGICCAENECDIDMKFRSFPPKT